MSGPVFFFFSAMFGIKKQTQIHAANITKLWHNTLQIDSNARKATDVHMLVSSQTWQIVHEAQKFSASLVLPRYRLDWLLDNSKVPSCFGLPQEGLTSPRGPGGEWEQIDFQGLIS